MAVRAVPLLARGLLGEWVDKASQLLVDDLPTVHAVANQVARVLLAHAEQLGAAHPLIPPVARVWLRADLADRYAGVLAHWGDDVGRAAATQVGRRLGCPTPPLRVEVRSDTTLRRTAYQVSSLPSWATAVTDDRPVTTAAVATTPFPTTQPVAATQRVAAVDGGSLVLTRPGRPERLRVHHGDHVELGRAAGPLGLSAERTVSAQHCRITWEHGDPVVTHLSRTNPTLVNGVAVSRATLADGDSLEIGTVVLAVAWDRRTGSARTGPFGTGPLGTAPRWTGS